MKITLDKIVPWGRSFDEYCRMFDLSEGDLNKQILGCGDGPASFNVELTARGGSIVSVDPMYRFSAEEIGTRIQDVVDEMIEKARARKDAFVWREITSPEHLRQTRLAAMQLFLGDFPSGLEAGRYLEASLPGLPFEDTRFDFALCGHYLFTYSDLLSEADHIEAILEMNRVARETRIFPLVDMFDGGLSPHLKPVMQRLKRQGLSVSIRRVPYEFQRGGNEMLIVNRSADPQSSPL